MQEPCYPQQSRKVLQNKQLLSAAGHCWAVSAQPRQSSRDLPVVLWVAISFSIGARYRDIQFGVEGLKKKKKKNF